jgi:hypothetical protein
MEDIRMGFWKIGWEGVNWMHLVQDKEQWRALVNMTVNPWVL